jgi:hypothetical protein
LFNTLQGCQTHPCPMCKLDLAPAQESARRADLSRISHALAFRIRSPLTTARL